MLTHPIRPIRPIRITFDTSPEFRLALRYLSLDTGKGYRELVEGALSEKYPQLSDFREAALPYVNAERSDTNE